MKNVPRLLIAAFLIAAMVKALIFHSPVESKSAPVIKPTPASSAPVATAGLRAYVDPATGRLAPPPAKAVPDPAGAQLFNSSHAGLVEEPGTTAAGGFKVDTRGHFQSAITIQVGSDGKPIVNCTDQPVPAR